MVIHIGVDACTYKREKENSENSKDFFKSMIGCAIVTENLDLIKKAYYNSLSKALVDLEIDCQRKVLCSSEILTYTNGDMKIHEEIFKAVHPHISKLNIFYVLLNSKRIPKIKVYGKKKIIKEIEFEEFYNSHLVNSFPHICLWKISSYIFGSKAQVHIDHFQSELTNAWQEISKHPSINCYIHGDMVNILISIADIICRLIDYRLKEKNYFLRGDNIIKIFPELENKQIHTHWVGNKDLPRITMIHTNRVQLNKIFKRPIFYIYKEQDCKLGKNIIFSSSPKFMNFVHKQSGCVKFFTKKDITTIKNNDYIITINKKSKEDADTIKELLEKQMGINITSSNINDFS